MKRFPLGTLILALIFTSSCGVTDPLDVATVNYSLTTAIIPSDGGTVSPSGGEFEEGSEVNIEATAEPGFSFSAWEGDLSGSENPTVIAMDSDKEITAVFVDLRSEYNVMLALSDGVDQVDLELGQIPAPDDASVNAPPSPPEGALDGRFDRGDEAFFKDYRTKSHAQVEWLLTYQQGEADELTLSWVVEAVEIEGSLIMSSSRLAEEVDMLEQSQITFTGSGTGSFTIIYTRES